MRPSLVAIVCAFDLAVFALGGCGSSPSSSNPAPNPASSGNAGNAGATTINSGGAAGSGGDDASGATGAGCTIIPVAHAVGETGVATLHIGPVLAGQPMVYGMANALASNGSLIPTDFRFYVSHVELLGMDGSVVPADLVASDGTLEQYGVHLFSAEDPASATLRVRAKAGAYPAIRWLLGLDSACTGLDPNQGLGPLSTSSQMTWPLPLGHFLGLRFEAQLMAGAAGAGGESSVAPIGEIHMGTGAGFAGPVVSVNGSLLVPSAAPRQIDLDMDELFKAASMPIAPGVPSLPSVSPEVDAGERLRIHAADVPLFTLAP